MKRLQNQVTELQKQVDCCSAKLLLAEDEVKTLGLENLELKLHKLETPIVGNHVPPDYEAVRTRTLNKLKVGRQSAQGKAIDAFIREL